MDDLEGSVRRLEASGDFRVLRRVDPAKIATAAPSDTDRLGVFLDLETTGLDPQIHEIIEIGMVPFRYTDKGAITQVDAPFSALRQPSIPIPPDVTALTGLTDADVAGRTIDPAAVAAFVDPATFIVAHNAGFDRKFAERFCPAFATKPWACSMSQVPWSQEGYEGTRLGYLLASSGLFSTGHRAAADCLSALAVLARPLPRSGQTGLAWLLAEAGKTTVRIWAEGSPFDLKDRLKERLYKWNDGSDRRPKAWYVDVPEDLAAEEIRFLEAEIYRRKIEPRMQRLTALDRFSVRA